jgi:hypothetical protein
MDRREFLQWSTGLGPARVEASCEQLYMEYLDARLDGHPERAFLALEKRLREASELRLRDTAWLVREDFKQDLDVVLAAFKARGGRVELR